MFDELITELDIMSETFWIALFSIGVPAVVASVASVINVAISSHNSGSLKMVKEQGNGQLQWMRDRIDKLEAQRDNRENSL